MKSKRLLYILVVFFLFQTKDANSQTSDSTLNQILSINKANFTNKSLDSIITVLPNGYLSMKVYGIRNTARMLKISYPNNVWIELHVRQFSHMNPVDSANQWNTAQMRLENLHSASVYKGLICYEGCPTY